MIHNLAPIGTLVPRQLAAVAGRVVAVEVQPRDSAPTLTVHIDDGTGRIEVEFMGRRAIAGIEPGAHLTLTGRVSGSAAMPKVFNPRFELTP